MTVVDCRAIVCACTFVVEGLGANGAFVLLCLTQIEVLLLTDAVLAPEGEITPFSLAVRLHVNAHASLAVGLNAAGSFCIPFMEVFKRLGLKTLGARLHSLVSLSQASGTTLSE
jgi:hypothetical protein